MLDVRLPPIYRLVQVGEADDVADTAAALAAGGAAPGTLICADDVARFHCALVVQPGETLAEARRVLYVASLGLNDALGAVVPAGIDLTCHWPDRIDANAAAVARVGLRTPEGAGEDRVPDWIVLTADVAVAATDAAPEFFETTLHDEGCAEVTSSQLLESFTRHFLTWSNRWQDDGFEPIRAMWLRHAYDLKRRIEIDLAGGRFRGEFQGIDATGALEVRADGRIARISLAAALSRPIMVRRVVEPEAEAEG